MELLDDHEQGVRVQQWLRDNMSAIIGGLVIGFGVIFGWNWFQTKQLNHKAEASSQYRVLEKALAAEQYDEVAARAQTLVKDFDDTIFSELGLLSQAQGLMAQGKLDEAHASLKTVATQSKTPGLADLAYFRLARVELAKGEHDAAEASLKNIKSDAFKGMKAAVLGDVYLAKAQKDQAISAYRDAITHLDSSSPLHNLVKLKLGDLGVKPEVTLGGKKDEQSPSSKGKKA